MKIMQKKIWVTLILAFKVNALHSIYNPACDQYFFISEDRQCAGIFNKKPPPWNNIEESRKGLQSRSASKIADNPEINGTKQSQATQNEDKIRSRNKQTERKVNDMYVTGKMNGGTLSILKTANDLFTNYGYSLIRPSQTTTMSLPTQLQLSGTEPIDQKLKMEIFFSSLLNNWNEIADSEVFNPYPMSISKSTLELQRKLQGAIHRALVTVVERYDEDERLRTAFPLSEEVLRIVRPAMKKKPFRVGNYRPDFVHNLFGDIWVCEINARFPLNGYIFTHVGNKFLRSLSSVSFGLINEINEVADSILNLLQLSPLEKGANVDVVVGILKKRERGGEVHFLKGLFAERRGVEFIFVDPVNLVVVNTDQRAALMDFSTGKIARRWLCELHQDEILALPEEIATLLFDPEKNIVVNDVRTVFFCHDKRMLSVITNINLMRDFLQLEDLEVIRDHVLPTFIVGHLEQGLLGSLEKDEWVLKPSLLGKKEGIIFGKSVTEEAWRSALFSSPSHILQRFIRTNKQRVLTVESINNCHQKNENLQERVRFEDHLIVGTLLCSNDRFLGPGIYRSSVDDDDLIDFRRRRYIFSLPVLEVERAAPKTGLAHYQRASFYQKFLPQGVTPFPISDDCCFSVSLPTDLSDVLLYQRSLMEHGIALIHIRFSDPDSAFMMALVSAIGQPNPNSKSHDTLWDIRYDPKQSQGSCSRSLSVREFPFHTDCSFEASPPRYLAPQVLHADRYGGGLTELLDGRAILGDLTPEDILALKIAKFRFEVPKEFHKSVFHIDGPILSQDGVCFLFREDIITPPEGDYAAATALAHLKELLEARKHAAHLFLPNNTIILLDNGRFFHGRSKIIDHSRHLRRIRFHPKDASLIPSFDGGQ